jgi:hypothetical protein
VTNAWKRTNYLVHRWIGIGLGILVFVWFASGIVMIYYPWPAPNPSVEHGWLAPFAVPPNLIGFDSARAVAERFQPMIAGAGSYAGAPRRRPVVGAPFSGARLMQWNGRLVYSLWRQAGDLDRPMALVDARTGTLLSPISADDAVAVGRHAFAATAPAAHVDLLDEGDHYMLSGEYQPGFPAYRVELGDASHSTAYVNRNAGYVVGLVTDRTRWTTWLGTVPHWLYFKWLYHRLTLWLWVSYVLPAVAALGALTGVTIGTYQLFPKRRRGQWRVSGYHGVSKWHHVTGILFGTLVFTWAFSGVLEVLGPGNGATRDQVVRARSTPRVWPAMAVSELDAARRVSETQSRPARPIAVDLVSLEGRFGYVFLFADGNESFVDGTSGAVRGMLDAGSAARIAVRAFGEPVPVRETALIAGYDAYYYARPGRELTLPVWRVRLGDAQRSAVYLDPVSGRPVGYVFTTSRVYRWLRDGLHSFDFSPVSKRPLWDAVLLPLMIGGTVAAVTGVWLSLRRLQRMS